MKFKVGDRVKVVKTNSAYSSKKEYIGRVFTIVSVRENNEYPYDTAPSTAFWWREDELELVPFTKSDLKDGMVVRMRDGSYRFVFNKRVMTDNENIGLSAFNDDMEHFSCDDYNIDKIYTTSARFLDDILNPNYLTLIWERGKSAKKMTVEEIEKELGYKVEIVSKEN